MINLNEPEPELKQCVFCSKRDHLKGTLIHFPNEKCTTDEFTMYDGSKMKSFSMWLYICQWHKAAETRIRNKRNKVVSTPNKREG